MGRGGDDLASPRAAPLSPRVTGDLIHDSRFLPFLSESFDASQFASSALEDTRTTAQAQIDYLQEGIADLDAQIRKLVLHNRGDLIRHTSKLDETDSSLQRISLSVRSLQSVAARVRAEVMEPYAQLVSKTHQLRNVQRTVDLLRHTIHRVKLVQRLRAETASGSAEIMEVAKAARILSEVRAADAEADLSGIAVIDQDAEFLATTGAALRSRIDVCLRAGLDMLSQAEVGSALQALYNLHELRPAVESYVESVVTALERAFSSAMDPRKLSASGGGSGAGSGVGVRGVVGALQGATARVQEALWERLGEAFESLWRAGVAVWHLQRVLLKKRDPLTHELFIDVVAPTEYDELPLDLFWDKTAAALSQAFASAFVAQRGGFVRDSLVSYYPRLAGLLEAACTRIIKDGSSRDAPPALSPQQASAIMATPEDAEKAFLAGANSRLQSAAVAAFPGGLRSLPTAADLQTLVARAHEELKGASAGGDRLATLAAAVVGSALGTAADRAEGMAAGGPEARAVSGACTPAQARNIALCNALQEVHRSVAALAPRLPPPAAAALVGPIDALQAAALDLVAPLFRAMVDAAQEQVARLHAQNLGADEGAEGAVVETSAYLRELVRQLAQYRVQYLSKFTPPPGIASASVPRTLLERMAARILTFFVRHASLARPLSTSGRLQLAKDAAELEAGVTQHLLPAEQLGAPLRALRAFRRLLFTETAGLEGAALLRDLPSVAVMHHLFSRAPPALESPHAANRLTPAQYSLWLDEHSKEEAVKFVKSALEAGAAKAGDQPDAVEVVRLIRKLAVHAVGDHK